MEKTAVIWLTHLLVSVTVWSLPRSLANDQDWSIGCVKEDWNHPYFRVSAGNYIQAPNLSGAECVVACSDLNSGYVRAGVSADGICLCSSVYINSSHTVDNTSCLYQSSKGLFFRVFPIAPLTNISIPESVLVFEEFRVNITTVGDPSCAFLVDFNDGRREVITTNNNSVTHVYKSDGKFTVKLTSEPRCLHDVITANIDVNLPFGNASLACPTLMETSETNSSCTLSVIGSEIDVTLDSIFLGTMSDTVVESLGIASSQFDSAVRLSPSREQDGTYLSPLTLASHDAIISALEVHVYRSGRLKFQIYTPKCPPNQISCFGDCVASDVLCDGPPVSDCSLGQELCLTLGQCNSTNRCGNSASTTQINITSVDYVVRAEFDVEVVSTGYTFRKLSTQIPIQRGEVIGWYTSSTTAGIEFSYSSSSSELFFPSQVFAEGQTVSKSLTAKRSNATHHVRLHLYTISVLEIGLTPTLPRILVSVNVSSVLYRRYELMSKSILVEERISCLQIVSPETSKYYPTEREVVFSFKVTNGTNVIYYFEPGDGSNFNISSNGTWDYSYRQTGNYTFHVIASNQINSVSWQGSLKVANDIVGLSFKKDPKDIPGEAGVPYTVEFQLDGGDGVVFMIDSGMNLSQFLTCANLTNERLLANFTYPEAGTYPITVTALSKYFHTNLSINSSIEVFERIRNLTLWQIKEGQVIRLSKDLQGHFSHQPLRIRANVSSGTSVTFNFSKPGTLISWFEASFKFDSGGDREITVTALNKISQLNKTLRVIVVEECGSQMSILDKRAEGEPLRTTRGYELKFSVEEIRLKNYSACNQPASCNWTFFWELSKKVLSEYKLDKMYNDSPVFFIEKGTLDVGLYKVVLKAFCNDSERSNKSSFSQTYFKIELTKPVALISGGYRRDVAYIENGEFTLDASSSYDPDIKYFNSTGLTFFWTSNASLEIPKNESSSIKVSMRRLQVKDVIAFKVTVIKSGNINDMAKQVIHIIEENVPTTEIKCKVNCLPFVLTTERLSLEGNCPKCPGLTDVTFEWSLEVDENGARTRRSLNESDTFTGLNKANVAIKQGVLDRNKTYVLKLKARRSSIQKESLSVYQFRTSSVPYGGTCTVNPETGVSVETPFQVSCEDWRSNYIPLRYSIRYQSSFTQNTAVSSVDDGDKLWILWYHGPEQTSPSRTLPSGPKDNNFNLSLVVEIQDSYGAYTRFNLTVQVKPRNLNYESIKEELSKLDSDDLKNDPQKIPQLVTTFSTILNEGTAKKTAEEAKQLRFYMVKLLSKVEAKTLPQIKQTSDAVRLTTYKRNQVSFDTQKVAAATLKGMSEALVNIASDEGTKSGQVIDETARNLISSLSKIMDASFFTGKDIAQTSASEAVKKNLYGTLSKKGAQLEEIGKETEEVMSKNHQIIDDVSFAILKNKLVGERPTVTETDNFTMKLSNTLQGDIHGSLNRVNNNSGWFRLPQDEKLFSLEDYTQVYTQLISFYKNPYPWDIERSPFIQPHVLSLKFTTAENQSIAVRNLSKDIEIFLSNKDQAIPSPLKTSNDGSELLLYNFKVEVSHFKETLLLDVKRRNRSTSGIKFFIRFGKQVSRSEFDFYHHLPDSCTSCNGRPVHITESTVLIRQPEKLEEGSGEVSIGIFPFLHDEMSTQSFNSSAQGYDVRVMTVSCRFWNKSAWMEDGCKVGPKTTPRSTQCFCNHLTSFGSYIVKPNPLTKFSAKDFREGYVVFVAVVVIFLLYLLVLVWARKTDQHDFAKVGVCALPDNNPQDTHRYEIAVWTGMRRNAGTESEVTVILSGDVLDSEPRRLVNPHAKGFQRGSLEKFLLTTPEDIGSLYCIRIWHDNSKGSWYLSRVLVTDLEKDERYYFICDRWLAVDEDDGAIERLLPVAGEEELVEFQHLFLSRTKRNLSDSHLWISVVNRPPQSPFTRVQRLSCCLCFLMLSMLANAMFYGARSEPKPDSTNFIGSYSFTWDEVFIGVSSSLIVFPMSVIILYIFRNVRPKPVKPRHQSEISLNPLTNLRADPLLTSSNETHVRTASGPVEAGQIHTYYDARNSQVLEKAKVQNKKGKKMAHRSKLKDLIPRLSSSLPYWFVYFAWFLLVILTLGSATVVILYGMQFGNGRSLQWLFSNVVSICEDILVVQPLKVLALALVFALLVKKPDEGEFRASGAESLQDDEELLVDSPSDSASEHKSRCAASPELLQRPDEGQLRLMREARLKERKMFGLIHEIIVHLLFTIIVALITYGHKDSRSISLFQNLDELRTTTKEIRNFSGVWDWSRNILIPNALPKTLYNSKDVPSYGFFEDGYNNLLSSARLRLLRVNKDSCAVPDVFRQTTEFCAKDYSIFDQDEACYDRGWMNTSSAMKDETSPWCFQSWRKLDGYPYWGIFTTYSGSGYVNVLSPGDTNNDTANNMQALRWLDRNSRALFVELTVYNANVNLFASIMLLFEFPSYGGVFFSRDIRPLRLKMYVGGFAFFIFACEVLFMLFIAAYFYVSLKKIYHYRLAYFKKFWNLIDFAIVSVSLVAIGVYIYRINMTTALMRRVEGRSGEFVNFQYVTYWSEVFNCLIAVIISLTTLKLTKLMRFNLRVSLFGMTLQRARPALAMFGVQFGIVFFAYVMVGCLVFGQNVSGFKSILWGSISLGRVILGKSQFLADLSRIDHVIGPLFFFTFVLFVSWILINMFMAILDDAYNRVRLECGTMSNEYEIIDFFLARFRAWFGVRKVKVPPRARWQNARLKVRGTDFISRRRLYLRSEEDIALEKTGDLLERLEDSILNLENRVHLLYALDDVE